MLYSSGIGARLPDGSVPEGVTAQTREILDKLRRGLTARGLSLGDVVKVTIYLTDLRFKAEMNAEYNRAFPGPNAPVRTTVGVAALDPGLLVEMEFIAARPPRPRAP